MKDVTKKYFDYAEQLHKMTGGFPGYIVPAKENGRYVERTFLRRSAPGVLGRPFAWIGFDMESGILLYYKHCISENFIDTEKHPADEKLKGEFATPRTAQQQQEYEQQLWETYKKIREFVFHDDLTDEQKELLKEYKEIWDKAVMTDLIPFYKALSPEFFEWLDKNKQ